MTSLVVILSSQLSFTLTVSIKCGNDVMSAGYEVDDISGIVGQFNDGPVSSVKRKRVEVVLPEDPVKIFSYH